MSYETHSPLKTNEPIGAVATGERIKELDTNLDFLYEEWEANQREQTDLFNRIRVTETDRSRLYSKLLVIADLPEDEDEDER